MFVLDGFNLPDLSATRLTGFLHKVDLKNCNIQLVDDETFTGIPNLEALALNDNMLTELPEHFLRGLGELRTFEIENNGLTSIPRNLFYNLKKLAKISLKGNHITHILDYTFSGLHGLNSIDVTNNRLQHVGDKAIDTDSSDYIQLEKIDFSNNNLTDFPTFLLSSRRLWTIDLSANEISFEGMRQSLGRMVAPGFIQQANVESASDLNQMYKPVAEKTILLHDNYMEEFNVSSFSGLEWENFKLLLNFFNLELNGNQLLCNCKMFSFYKYLQSMDINAPRDYGEIGVKKYNIEQISCQVPSNVAGTPVAKVQETIFGCVEDVPHCPQNCSCWVRTVDGAVVVDCQKQYKTKLPDTLPEKSIKLNFSQNDLTKLPNKLPAYLPHLENMDLSNNGLKEFPGDAVSQLCTECHVLLHRNELKTLPMEVNSLRMRLQQKCMSPNSTQ